MTPVTKIALIIWNYGENLTPFVFSATKYLLKLLPFSLLLGSFDSAYGWRKSHNRADTGLWRVSSPAAPGTMLITMFMPCDQNLNFVLYSVPFFPIEMPSPSSKS